MGSGCTPPTPRPLQPILNHPQPISHHEAAAAKEAAGSRPADLAVSHGDLSTAAPRVTHSLIKQPSIRSDTESHDSGGTFTSARGAASRAGGVVKYPGCEP